MGYNTQQYTTTHNNTQHHNNNITTMHNNTQQYATIHDNSQQYTTIHNNTQQYTTIHNNSKQYMTLAFQVKRAKLRILFTYTKSSRLFFWFQSTFFSRYPLPSSFYHLLELKVGSHNLWLPTENVSREPQSVAPYWKCK